MPFFENSPGACTYPAGNKVGADTDTLRRNGSRETARERRIQAESFLYDCILEAIRVRSGLSTPRVRRKGARIYQVRKLRNMADIEFPFDMRGSLVKFGPQSG